MPVQVPLDDASVNSEHKQDNDNCIQDQKCMQNDGAILLTSLFNKNVRTKMAGQVWNQSSLEFKIWEILNVKVVPSNNYDNYDIEVKRHTPPLLP